MQTVTRARLRRMHYGYLIVALAVLSSMGAIGLARLGYSLMLPGMKDGLGLSFTETGQIATGNFIGYLAMALAGGALATRFGPRLVVTWSAVVGGLFLVLTALSSNFWMAFFTRLVTGLGSGGMNVPMLGLLAAWFSPRRRGMVSGTAVAGTSLAVILSGEYLPGIMQSNWIAAWPAAPEGWRYGWLVVGCFVVAFAVIGGLLLRNRPEELGLLPVGVDAGSAQQAMHSDGRSGWAQVYRSRELWRLAALYLLFGFAYVIYATFFVAHLRDRGLSLAEAGSMWGWLGWISLPSAFVWGWVSDVIGRKFGLAIVYLLLGLACIVFAAATARDWFFVSLVLYGVGGWSVPGIMAAAAGDYVPPRFVPAALGMITLLFGVGQAVGPWIGGSLRDASGSFASAFVLSGIAALLAVVVALTLRRPKAWA